MSRISVVEILEEDYNPSTADVLHATSVAQSINTSDGLINPAQDEPIRKNKRGLSFWLSFVSILICQFLPTLEMTGTSTALPIIVQELKGDQFIWVGSAYGLAATVFLPLSGALADAFGRRPILLISLALFAFGSALCGAATNLNFLIAGRTVQGLGGGGIASLQQTILSDMISLEERGKFMPFLSIVWMVASSIGPIVGGSLAQNGQWRWFFYLNIPICGVAALITFTFVHLRIPPGTLKEKLSRIDIIGSALIISCSSIVILSLTWGGVQYSWSSVQVLVPLIVGLLGMVAFMIYEVTLAKHPLVPISLLETRTAASGYLQTFIALILTTSFVYYLPVYFQACKGSSPTTSGLEIFGFMISGCLSGIPTSISISVLKKYAPQLWLSWIFMVVGSGIISILTTSTSVVSAIGLEVVVGVGGGMLFVGTYFPVLAPQPVSANARAMAFFMFVRYFAQVWGITIGGVILQNGLQQRLPASFLGSFPVGGSIALNVVPEVSSLAEPLRTLVRDAFAESLRIVWYFTIGVSGLGLIVSFAMKQLPLHTTMAKEYGLEDEVVQENVEESQARAASGRAMENDNIAMKRLVHAKTPSV